MTTRSTSARPPSPWLPLAAVAALYVSLGAVIGFVQGGIGPILRSKGVALASMGWVFALYLPFGLTFLWAPWIDRRALPWLGRRTGWIITAQAVGVAAVVGIAFGAALPVPALYALALAATLSVSTMDVALDAWTVEHIPAAYRSAASGAKVGGMSLGAVFGGGLLVGVFPSVGWTGVFLLLAAVMALATVPVWMLQESGPGPHRRAPAQASLAAALRQPVMRSRLLRVSLVTCALMALFNMNRLMLVDLGVPLARIGWVMGIAAPLANLAAAIATPWLLTRAAPRPVLWAFVGAAVASTTAIMAAVHGGHAGLAIAASVTAGACVAGIYIVLGGLILGWASGGQAATDYSLLYGVGRFIGTLALLGMPALIARAGWLPFYATAGIAAALSTAWLLSALPGRRPAPQA